jgi:hypothetical protein
MIITGVLAFGTKSPYPSPPVYKEPFCSVSKVEILLRHGSRFPTVGIMEDILDLITKLKESNPYHPYIQHLSFPYSLDLAGSLLPGSETAISDYGERLGLRYPFLLYNSLYSASNSHRVISTGRALMDSIGVSSSIPILIVPNRTLDADLNPSKACSRYATIKIPNHHKVWRNHNIGALLKKIRLKLMVDLSASQIVTLYELCAFEVNMFGPNKPLSSCAFFDSNDMEIMEIMKDMKSFYRFGYGHVLHSHLACSLFESFASNLKTPKSHLRFSHSETLISLISYLDLFKDAFSWNNSTTVEQFKSRAFRSSRISPFLGNVILEKLTCDDADYLRIFLNEELIDIPKCPSPCKIDDFIEIFRKGCNFDSICQNNYKTVGGWKYAGVL